MHKSQSSKRIHAESSTKPVSTGMKLSTTRPPRLLIASFIACLLATAGNAAAQGDGDVEVRFIAMLKDATLKGTWAPIRQGQLGSEKGNDRYRIARVEKTDDGKWIVVSRFTVQGRTVEFPISASVKFAGDTAVLILDEVRTGSGKANWSARIMFHDDVYAGRWWETANPEHGGTIAGTITRASEPSP